MDAAAGSTNQTVAALVPLVGFAGADVQPDRISCKEGLHDMVYADYAARAEYFEAQTASLFPEFCEQIHALPCAGRQLVPLQAQMNASFETCAIEELIGQPLLKVRVVYIVFAAVKTRVAVARADFLEAATSYFEKVEELVKRIFIDMCNFEFGYTPTGVAAPIRRRVYAAA